MNSKQSDVTLTDCDLVKPKDHTRSASARDGTNKIRVLVVRYSGLSQLTGLSVTKILTLI